MDNNSYLSKIIQWTVLLPDGKELKFENPMSELEYEEKNTIQYTNSPEEFHNKFELDNEFNTPSTIYPEDSQNRQSDGDSHVLLLDILQDFYYVTHLDLQKNDNNVDRKLEFCDNCWSALRVYWRCLLELVKEKQNLLDDDNNSEKRDILFIKKGRSYRKFINSMGEPYTTRYFVYRLLKPLYSLRPKSMTLGYCTDIICNFIEFQKFWNNGLVLFADILLKIQKIDSVNKLERILKKITQGSEYKIFQNRYILKNGCFMLAKVKFEHIKKDVLCFSGLGSRKDVKKPKTIKEEEAIKKAIETIMQSGYFRNPYLVEVSDKIRYYLPDMTYITFGEAELVKAITNEKINYNPRMFSCCERKTFADFNWNGCQSYKMIVRFAPCELCQYQVNLFEKLYNGKTIYGKPTEPLKKRSEFDEIAMNIYNKLQHIKRSI